MLKDNQAVEGRQSVRRKKIWESASRFCLSAQLRTALLTPALETMLIIEKCVNVALRQNFSFNTDAGEYKSRLDLEN